MNKLGNKETGAIGEHKASLYLKNHGYKILERNFRAKTGEIDIIAQKDGVIAFVEVKTRGRNAVILGREAVTPSKQRKIIKTALYYLSANNVTFLQPRFDVIEITVKERVKVVHIENAFDGSSYRGFI